MKKLLTAVLTIALICAAFPTTTALAGATPVALGTTRTTIDSGVTYEIGSQAELAHLASLVNGDQQCVGATFVLTADITITNDYDSTNTGNWTPIGYLPDAGYSKNMFGGTFYGGNHTVTIDVQVGDYGGLFGAVGADGIVQDLKVAGSIVAGSNSGGIAGYNGGMIKNCTNNATITDAAATGNENVGGIAGMNHGDIICCSNNGSVSGENDCGGISGENSRSANDVYFCFNTNSVSGTNNVGGISGNSPGDCHRTTENCYNTGSITGSSNVGGIQGYCGTDAVFISDNSLFNCYNTGSVTGSVNVGAIEGFMHGWVQNCYWLAGTAADTVGFADGHWPSLCDSFQVPTYTLTPSPDFPIPISLFSALQSFFNMSHDITWAWDPGTAPYLAGVRIIPPDDQYALAGGTASFTADVYGWSVTYQWQMSTDSGAHWTNLSGNGADTPTYNTPAMTPEMSGWQYRCIVGYVSGTTPHSATTNAATLYLGSAPAITSQPESTVYAADGQLVAMIGVAAGAEIPPLPGYNVIPLIVAATPNADYMWYGSTDGGKNYGWIGSAASFTMLPGLDGWMFYCVATNSLGSVTSDVITLKLCTMPVISAQPQNAGITEGSTATFAAAATGLGLSYQWQVSADGTTWNNVTGGSGQASASYTTAPATVSMNGSQYRCVVTNAAGSVNTDAAALTVSKAVITDIPERYTMYTGGRVIWDPQPEGGTWNWDETFFSATFNSPATFTALKPGTSTISYTVGETTRRITVTVKASSLPATGQDFTWVYVFGGIAIVLAIGTIYGVRKRVKTK